MNSPIKHIAIFIGLVLLQSLVLNQVNIHGYINPYVFPLFIILLPFNTKEWVMLLMAFFLGLTIDLFNGTMGMHTFALVLMAFARPFFLANFPSKIEKLFFPSLKGNGFSWMLFYVFVMIFIHHFTYFFIEAGSFNNLFHTLALILMSSIMSIFIIFLLLFTFNKDLK